MVGKREKGEGRKKAKESRVVPHPKLNPGCATVPLLIMFRRKQKRTMVMINRAFRGQLANRRTHFSVSLLTTGVENSDNGCFPDEVVNRFHGFTGYIYRRDGLVMSGESERHGTNELSGIFNV